MRKAIVSVVVVLLVSLSALAWARTQKPPASAQSALPSQASVEEVLKAMRADMQETRADIMAKNLTLTAAQAAKFWPLFETYQKQQNAIMDEQLKGIQKYAESYATLDDAAAVALMQAHFDRDTKMNALRQQFLKEFQTVVPAKIAARAMQIDRRLSLVAQLEIAAKLPLIH